MPRAPSVSTIPASPNPLARLPVNPRRKKVAPEERRRVATACNSCNVRRIKCNGKSPCDQCMNAGRQCLYPVPVVKVTIAKDDLDNLHERIANLQDENDALQQSYREAQNPYSPAFIRQHVHPPPELWEDPPGGRVRMRGWGRSRDEHMVIDGAEGVMLHDGHGNSRFHGATSGATFLDALKQFISVVKTALPDGPGPAEPNRFLQSMGQYQTQDSRPLVLPPDQDVDPLQLPPPDQMKSMLDEVRVFLMDAGGKYETGGIYYWPIADLDFVVASINASGSPSAQSQNARRLALYHACFAFATLLRSKEPGSRADGHVGEEYIARARKLLGNPLDSHLFSIDDVPALALMALYYVENNRRDFAFSFVSTAMNICRTHGIYRGTNTDPTQQRMFWTLYVLDRWLSCLMGRVPSIPDFAIKLPLPREQAWMPPVCGLDAHTKLSYISNFIVHVSYRGFRRDDELLPGGVIEAQSMLRDWERNLPEVLKIPENPEPRHLLDRARCSLHMAYHQLYIVTARPAFLAAIRRSTARSLLGENPEINNSGQYVEEDEDPILRKCSNSARTNIMLARHLRGGDNGTQTLLVQELHHLFNAAVILMMNQLGFLNRRTKDTSGIEFAIRVFHTESEKGSAYAIDCLQVLVDLWQLVAKLRPRIFNEEPEPPRHVPGPGEQILASILRPPPPPFRPFGAQGSGVLYPPPLLSPDIRNQLNIWKDTVTWGLYVSPECMIDA